MRACAIGADVRVSEQVLVFRNVYQFSIGECGLIYNTQILGSFLGLFIDHWCNKLYLKVSQLASTSTASSWLSLTGSDTLLMTERG